MIYLQKVMQKKRFLLIFILSVCLEISNAQTTCSTLGQNPSSAFPVCGTLSFVQNNVPICGNRQVPNNKCSDYLTDKNPFWYKFTCYVSGTFGFTITPNKLSDDYDWQIYDVTNRNPNDIYNDASMIIASNWSGESGVTGASSSGKSVFECANMGIPLFSAMPTLTQGHQYLLLVSHFSDSQSGYTLTFGGGTAGITDPNTPHLQNAGSICGGTSIAIKLNKKMKCSSLNISGDQFSITPASAAITNATAIGCSSNFDMDSVMLTLASPLAPGKYKVAIKAGNNGQMLLDNCELTIPLTDTQEIVVQSLQPTLMDSITTTGCAPAELQLVFQHPLLCSSIEPGGTDFAINGPSTVNVISANGDCSGGQTTRIHIKLASPIQKGGNYSIVLQAGSDGNTLLNECSIPTPAGSSLNFNIYDTVNADFSRSIQWGCHADTIHFYHAGANGVNRWHWELGDNLQSYSQDTIIIYTLLNDKNIRLTVSNGICMDTTSEIIKLNNEIKAKIEGTEFLCPTDSAYFKDQSSGPVTSWAWDFGNGTTSNLQSPPKQLYPSSFRNESYKISLVVSNDFNCSDTTYIAAEVFNNCNIAVATAFTPNHDGLNDYLYPINAYKARNLVFKVYNRNGQLIFSSTDWTKKWDGTFNGKEQDAGTYVWFLQYTHADTGKKYVQKGTTILIR